MTGVTGFQPSGIRLWVEGLPIPQGSKGSRVMWGKGGQVFSQLFDTNATDLKPWRGKVATQARLAAQARLVRGEDILDGPLHLACTFLMPLPLSRRAYIRQRGWGWCSVKPDLDKLVRAVGDGLTDGGLIADDSRICSMHVRKLEHTGQLGVWVDVARLDPDSQEPPALLCQPVS